MKKTTTLLALAGVAATAAAGTTVNLTEIARVELTGAMFGADSLNGQIGQTVAWNGSSLFVGGGFNGGTNDPNSTAAIIRIDDVFGAQTVGASFAQQTGTPNGRGWRNLDWKDGKLAASYEGSAAPNGLAVYDASGNLLAGRAYNGGTGVAWDPGFGGAGGGVAAGNGFFTSFFQTYDANTATLDSAYGFQLTPDGGPLFRDIGFQANGDAWAREGNALIQHTRTGLNTFTGTIVKNGTADFVNGQNLAVVEGSAEGDFVIYNDRPSTSTGQSFLGALKAVDLGGTDVMLDFSFLSALGTPDDGSGYYDFSYDAATQTLAVLNFVNREVHIFKVPAPGAAALLGLGGLVAARRRRA